jgi:group I intron endonuclease
MPKYEVADEYKVESGIYVIRCLVDDKIYIGCTVNLSKRWGQHKWCLKNNKHRSCRLQRAWNEYGSDKFVWEILEYVYNVDVLGEVEDYWIARYKSNDCWFGFNSKLAHGRQSEEVRKKIGDAHRGKKISEEARRKSSETQRGRKLSAEQRKKLSEGQRKRKPPSEETRKKLREAKLGKKFSEEHKQKISQARLGTKHSEETKRKVSEANRGKKLSEEHKKKFTHRGRKHSEEARKKISDSILRRSQSGENTANI